MAKNSKMGFDPSAEIQSTLDKVAFKMADADTLDDVQPMSSGLLIIDCMTGGGIRPAMYTSAGKEQTGKTTLALTILASAIHEKIHTKSVRDYEGSTGNSIPYVTSIMQTYGVNLNKDELFGKKDPRDRWDNFYSQLDPTTRTWRYDGFKVPVFEAEWVDTDIQNKLYYRSVHGRNSIIDVDWDYTEQIKELSPKAKEAGAAQEVKQIYKRVIRQCKWICYTKDVFDWGVVPMAAHDGLSKVS